MPISWICGDAFVPTRCLTTRILDLSYNSIRKIEQIAHLVKLVKLFLCNNKISAIENIETLTELVMLELGGNRIRVSCHPGCIQQNEYISLVPSVNNNI